MIKIQEIIYSYGDINAIIWLNKKFFVFGWTYFRIVLYNTYLFTFYRAGDSGGI